MLDDETNERYTLLWTDSRYENVPPIYDETIPRTISIKSWLSIVDVSPALTASKISDKHSLSFILSTLTLVKLYDNI